MDLFNGGSSQENTSKSTNVIHEISSTASFQPTYELIKITPINGSQEVLCPRFFSMNYFLNTFYLIKVPFLARMGNL